MNAIGDPDLQRIRRHIMDVLDQLSFSSSQMEVIRSGGCAEGFRMKGTDVDQMYVDKLTKVVAETPKNLCTSLAIVKLMQLSKVPPCVNSSYVSATYKEINAKGSRRIFSVERSICEVVQGFKS